MSIHAILLAAGAGTRMGLPHNKALHPLCGVPVVVRSARAFQSLVDGLIIVGRAEETDRLQALLPDATIVAGGKTRQQSVLRGLHALPEDATIALIHDGARPFAEEALIRRCIKSAMERGSGIPCLPVTDTLKTAEGDRILHTLDRESLRAVQTPQAFQVSHLRPALEAMEAKGITATDDASALEMAGQAVYLVEGSRHNIKLTTREDLLMAEWMLQKDKTPRVGHGYDVHRLVAGRPLILCGVPIPYDLGLLGHSDGDVALHALMDALLGAAGLYDIGRHFPDQDPAYQGISSLLLLERVQTLLLEKGFAIVNVDITIVAQRPKLAPHMAAMTQAVAAALKVHPSAINIKATTTEGLGFEGEGLGISATAVALIEG